MKKVNVCLTALAVVLVLGAGLHNIWAYFTTYAEAQGGYVIELGDRTHFEERFSDWTKRLAVTSKTDSQPVYVRAKAFCGVEYSLVYEDAEGKWNLNEADGYYYYSDILYAGQSTSELLVKIDGIKLQRETDPQTGETIYTNDSLEAGDQFNVVVIYESTPVRYDGNGNPYADWDAEVSTDVESDPGDGQGGGE